MVSFLKPDWSHEIAIQLIKDSTTDRQKANDEELLFVPSNRKRSLLKTVNTSRQAGEPSLVRVLLAAKKYRNSNKDINSIML